MTLEQVIQHVTTTTLEAGKYPTSFLVDATERSVTFPVKNDPHEAAHLGYNLAWQWGIEKQPLENLINVFYIAEGLLGSPSPIGSTRVSPSKDPNRIEAIRIDCLEVK